MIEGLKPYPEYKESGLAWLGMAPKHWATRRMKVLFRERVEKGHPKEPLLAATQTKGVVRKEDYGERTVTAQKDFHLLKLVEPDDFVISLRSFQGGIEYARCRGIISPAYTILAPNVGTSRGYFSYFLKSRFFVDSLKLFVTGIRDGQNIDYPRLSRSYMPFPPPDEQSAIVRFLDHANGKIERAIRAKRKLISLLNEQKQAIIHRAVTRGLDPDVKLKPSGIPWLGDVPEHWEVRRVKQIAKILRGKFTHRPRNDPSLYGGRYPFIQTGDVTKASMYITSHRQSLNETGFAVSKLFPKGTLVMTIAANIGDVAILGFDACFPDSLVGFVPCPKASREYLYRIFQCMKPELLREAPVNTQGNLNVERIGAMTLPLPPLDEQEKIATVIEIDTQTLNTTAKQTEREITLLREYRTTLTADVVTGKLDVREAAKHLPDTTPEATSLETQDEVDNPDDPMTELDE